MFFSTNDGKQCFFSTNDAMILRQISFQFGVDKTTHLGNFEEEKKIEKVAGPAHVSRRAFLAGF
jgi:hypothetical protein